MWGSEVENLDGVLETLLPLQEKMPLSAAKKQVNPNYHGGSLDEETVLPREHLKARKSTRLWRSLEHQLEDPL